MITKETSFLRATFILARDWAFILAKSSNQMVYVWEVSGGDISPRQWRVATWPPKEGETVAWGGLYWQVAPSSIHYRTF